MKPSEDKKLRKEIKKELETTIDFSLYRELECNGKIFKINDGEVTLSLILFIIEGLGYTRS